jgi:hypothetical protein
LNIAFPSISLRTIEEMKVNGDIWLMIFLPKRLTKIINKRNPRISSNVRLIIIEI